MEVKGKYLFVQGKPSVYDINIDTPYCGFFAVYRYMLEYLYFADRAGLIPQIRFTNFAYFDCDLQEKCKNPFEYYFLQPADIEIESLKVVESKLEHSHMVSFILAGEIGSYSISELYIEELAKMQQKYVRLNKKSEEFIYSGINRLLQNQKVLGVHARGTDYRVGYNNHPICVETKEYFEMIEKILNQEKYDYIFLATDDSNILGAFVKRYGDKVIYYNDVERAGGQVSVAFQKSNRNYHKYKLGLEVLRDAYTLAHCDSLIAGISQVNICARIIKRSMGQTYNSLNIIDKGIHRNNNQFSVLKLPGYEKQSPKDKMQQFYMLLVQWVKLSQNGINISDYLLKKGFRKVSIYGMKELGILLLNDLIDSEIEVPYAIDRNAEKINAGIKVIRPEEIDESIELIIVTAIYYYDEIKTNIGGTIRCPIISLESLITDILKSYGEMTCESIFGGNGNDGS